MPALKVLDHVSKVLDDVSRLLSSEAAQTSAIVDAGEAASTSEVIGSGDRATTATKELTTSDMFVSLPERSEKAVTLDNLEKALDAEWRKEKLQYPSQCELEAFEALRRRLDNGGILPEPHVNDALRSLDERIELRLDCQSARQLQEMSVRVQIETRLVSWVPGMCPGEADACFLWFVSLPVKDGDTWWIRCRNAVMFDFVALESARDEKDEARKHVDADFRRMSNLRLFYHEMLHGQLQINYMRNPEVAWGCKTLDLKGADFEHACIPDYELAFFNRLVSVSHSPSWRQRRITIAHLNSTDGGFESSFLVPDSANAIAYRPPFAQRNIDAATLTRIEGGFVLSGTLSNQNKDGTIHVYYTSIGAEQ